MNGKDDLVKYYNYLLKVFEMDMKALESSFTPIHYAKRIRNLIAHHNGYLDIEKKDKLNKIEGISYTEIEKDYFQVDIDEKEFVETISQKMDSFLLKMLISINQRYKALKS